MIKMMSVDAVNSMYAKDREYTPDYGGPFPIVDWIMRLESRGWIKGAERIEEGPGNYRIRFVYWEYKNNRWSIRRFHPVIDADIVKEIVDEMIQRKWI